MAHVYDNWERLVGATLRREDLRLSAERTPSDLSSASVQSPSSSARRLSSFNLTSFLSAAVGSKLRAFKYKEILRATYSFRESNLLKHGHSGDFFRGILKNKTEIVVKKINLFSFETESLFISELEILSKVTKSSNRFVPVLGYCLENEYEKFLVYKYMPNKDLSSSFYRENVHGGLKSLDWITRLKIATGAADALSYLHHDCDPPFVHGDIQASSILLDNNYEVRLGSLSHVSVQESRMILRTSEQGNSGTHNDIYSFGKVLLELVTGKIGMISTSSDAATKDWLKQTIPYINIYDKNLVTTILDPTLIIDDEDLFEEVWAMALVARACLNPKPSRRPLMGLILKALENPLKVVREEQDNTSTPRHRRHTNSPENSQNAAIFRSCQDSFSGAMGLGSNGEGSHPTPPLPLLSKIVMDYGYIEDPSMRIMRNICITIGKKKSESFSW